MKIYTKSGDDGTTGLYRAGRISKTSDRISLIGDLDELNAFLGLAAVASSGTLSKELTEIQSRLFDLGAEIASPTSENRRSVNDADVQALEHSIDEMSAVLPPLSAFILPGGSEAASRLHLARTVCRRAERQLFLLHSREPLRRECAAYLNRLSDWLFTAARLCNMTAKVHEQEWQPRETVIN